MFGRLSCGHVVGVCKRFASATKLDDYVKLDLLEKEDPKTVKKIWVEYHRNQHCVSAIIEPKVFNELVPRTNERFVTRSSCRFTLAILIMLARYL